MNQLQNANVYTDFRGLSELRREARAESPEALRAVAEQFESLFIQQMLKSMRDAKLADGMLEGDGVQFYQDMHDKQLALNMAEGQGIGLADMLVQQLSPPGAGNPAAEGGNGGGKDFPVPERRHFSMSDVLDQVKSVEASKTVNTGAAPPVSVEAATTSFDSPEAFIRHLWPQAQSAAERLGTKPEALIAQAALETGWGKAVIRHPDGSSSHNLFNIKADQRWDGDRVAKRTLEYRGGVAEMERASFRSYGSFEQSFNDYVDFLESNPRYRQALENAGDPRRFVESLQEAGYATDPAYARKIQRIMGSQPMADTLAALKLPAERTLT